MILGQKISLKLSVPRRWFLSSEWQALPVDDGSKRCVEEHALLSQAGKEEMRQVSG